MWSVADIAENGINYKRRWWRLNLRYAKKISNVVDEYEYEKVYFSRVNLSALEIGVSTGALR